MACPDLSLLSVREAVSSDRARIQTILELTGVFNLKEIQCALSLFDEYLEKGADPNEYVFSCACDEHQTPVGFVCYGKASLTDRVYDLYWIASDPRCGRQGIGTLLVRELDQRLKSLGARAVIAETSSKLEYTKSRNFYLKNDFKKAAVIKDYYALGDDLVFFEKRYS